MYIRYFVCKWYANSMQMDAPCVTAPTGVKPTTQNYRKPVMFRIAFCTKTQEKKQFRHKTEKRRLRAYRKRAVNKGFKLRLQSAVCCLPRRYSGHCSDGKCMNITFYKFILLLKNRSNITTMDKLFNISSYIH